MGVSQALAEAPFPLRLLGWSTPVPCAFGPVTTPGPSLASSQAKTVQEKRNWTHHIKRLILENHHTTIPQKVRSWTAHPRPPRACGERVSCRAGGGLHRGLPSGHWLH